MFRPLRAELTISAGSIGYNLSNRSTAILTVPIIVADYSPKEAHIMKWSLTLYFNNAPLQVSNKSCICGTTDLSPAQQTEFKYLVNLNDTLISRGIGAGTFSISFIDNLGTLQQQFVFYTPQYIAVSSSGTIVG
jgi:hypothetical protein